MSLANLRDFFLWCTVINAAILMAATLFTSAANNFIYRIHSKCFPISRESYNVILYSFLGLYKILIFVFNLAPLIAISIIM